MDVFGCFWVVFGCLWLFLVVFGYFLVFLRLGRFKGLSREFQGYIKEAKAVSGVFRECFKEVLKGA